MSGRHPSRTPYKRSSLSAGLQWASTITTVGLMMALPPLLGWWLDMRYGTSPLWTVVLAVLGFIAAMRQLWGIAKRLSPPKRSAPSADSTAGPGDS